MNLRRRLPQYALGLVIMAFGIVLIKKAELGMSPISAIPAAVANFTPLTLGNTTIAFHICCILMMIAVNRRADLKTALTLPLAVVFGYIIDLFMFLLSLPALPLWARGTLCFLGIMATALGIVFIVGADLMLPAPDAFLRSVSARTGKPLSVVKIAGDVTWVVITLIIELSVIHSVRSVGAGTVASMFLTGWFVGVFNRWFPGLKMAPTGKEKEPTRAPQ